MSVKHSNSVVVAVTATSLTAPVADHSGNNYEVARSLVLTNTGSVDLFLGGSDVTSASFGYKLAAGKEMSLDLGRGDELFAAVATGTSTVRILHLGV